MTVSAKTKIKPLGGRALIKRIEEAEQKVGGLFIPDSAKEKPQEAEIVALGAGARDDDGKLIPFQVKVGDRVLISKYGGTDIKHDDQEFQIVREDDILAILEK